ncbi:MAG: GTPase KRas precursor [Candidatus Heimdallarchaeota archaeon LC_2]|nr:MAG: GTPase KRas precursor [Candidatus Heimdallarchaeota archaeon LC_2]
MVTLGNVETAYNITLIGEPDTGKTSIKNALIGLPFMETQNSLKASFSSLSIEKYNIEFRLQVCDVGRNESFELIRNEFMSNSDAAIIVFDLTNKYSFQQLTTWIKEYCLATKKDKTPILILGNKLDLKNERKISLIDIQSILKLIRYNPEIEGRIVGYAETSAKTGENIQSSFRNLTSIIAS